VSKTALAVAETPEERPIKQLAPQRRKLAEYARQHHVVTVEDAEHPEDFLQPEFWALIAKDMQVGDRVDVQDDELTFFGEYLVMACDRTWAKLHKLHETALVPPKEAAVSPDFDIQYKGPHLKYCVIRKSDKSIVHEGAASRVDANSWLLGYARTTGAKIAA
jgi:hypothetical protein